MKLHQNETVLVYRNPHIRFLERMCWILLMIEERKVETFLEVSIWIRPPSDTTNGSLPRPHFLPPPAPIECVWHERLQVTSRQHRSIDQNLTCDLITSTIYFLFLSISSFLSTCKLNNSRTSREQSRAEQIQKVGDGATSRRLLLRQE